MVSSAMFLLKISRGDAVRCHCYPTALYKSEEEKGVNIWKKMENLLLAVKVIFI